MPKFFMNVRNGNELVEDCEGQEFTSVDAAREEAIHAAREMISGWVLRGEIVDCRQIEILDTAGTTVAIVPVRAQLRLAWQDPGLDS